MYRYLLAGIVSLSAAFAATAQQKGLYLGVEANPGWMSHKEDDNSSSPKFSHFSSYGLNLTSYYSEHWGLTTGTILAKYRYSGMNDLTLMGIKSLSYLQIPFGIVCRSNGTQPVNGYFNFGITTYLLTNADFSGPSGNFETYTTADLNKLNIGPYAGGGATISFAKRFTALVGAQFATGVMNVKKNPETFSYTFENDHLATVTLHLGLQVRLISASTRKSQAASKGE